MSKPDINRILRETFVVEVEHHGELGSTNDRAVERAKQGASKLPLMVIADRQTAGRGRGSNRWWTGSGSLAFSLLLDSRNCPNFRTNENMTVPFATPNSGVNSLISIATGVSLVETIKPLLQNKTIGLHWPNDIMAAGRKLAGILIEVLPDGRTVIGIGINTNNSMTAAPPELHPIATTLLDLTGKQHDQTEILLSLLNRLEKNLIVLKQTPAKITAQADDFCLQRGKTLVLQLGRQTINGLCRGIATDGAILLQTPDGIRPFYSGAIVE